MPAIEQNPTGHGVITWVGINPVEPQRFSQLQEQILVCEDGLEGDKYRGWTRKLSGHDVDYITTDGVQKGDTVLNLRQITIIEEGEVTQAGVLAGHTIERGMLRENMAVRFTSGQKFSGLQPLSRMVIGHGRPNPIVLLLTEENGPCRTICNPMANAFGGGTELSQTLRDHLGGNRGQMVMVKSANGAVVRAGDTFKIFPPMT